MSPGTIHSTAAGVVLAACAWAATASRAAAEGARLIVEVRGVPTSEGVVRVDVCTADTFLKTTCPYSGAAKATAGVTSVTVEGLPVGVYAVQAFHDRNDSGRLRRGAFGIPLEGVGFSNDAPLGLRGPSFARASFTHGADPQTITLRLRQFGSDRRSPPPSP